MIAETFSTSYKVVWAKKPKALVYSATAMHKISYIFTTFHKNLYWMQSAEGNKNKIQLLWFFYVGIFNLGFQYI